MRQRCNRWLMHWNRHRAYLFLRNSFPVAGSATRSFSYFVLDISAASDEYDIETEVRLATGYGNTAAGHLLLAVTPEGTLTDYNGVTRSAIAGAAYSALNMEHRWEALPFTISRTIITMLILFINRLAEAFNFESRFGSLN